MTFELEVALEQAGKHELLDVVRSVKPDDMECIYVRQAQALGPRPRGAVRPAPGRRRPVRGAAGRRPDGRRRRRSWRRWSSSSTSGARRSSRCRKCRPSTPGATASSPARRSTTALVDVTPHRREAGARGRAVAPGRRRPLHPDAAACSTRSPTSRAASAARSSSPTASPALLRREKVFAYRYDGKRYDCGSKEGFLQANVELALAHPELGAGLPRVPEAALRDSEPPRAWSSAGAGSARTRRWRWSARAARCRSGGRRPGSRAPSRGRWRRTFSTSPLRHVGQRLLGLQDRQRAVQAAGVEFFLGFHGVVLRQSTSTSVARLPGGSSMNCGSMPRERSQSASA